MKKEEIKLESGKIYVSTYSREDLKSKKFIRWVVDDLYRQLPDFNEEIYFIDETKPIVSKTVKDVLKEYVDKCNGDDKIILTRGCILTRDPNNNDLIAFINNMIYNAVYAGFRRILFNRCMANSYTLTDILILLNDKSKEFIGNNIGEDKIIKTVIASNGDDILEMRD